MSIKARGRRTEHQRFWSKVDFGPDCWEWGWARDQKGYGQTRHRATRKAHRVAFILKYGPIPSDMAICHTCDNRACVRPSHLRLGTQLENVRDRVNRGRARLSPTAKDQVESLIRPRGIARHERNGRARLTAADVKRIRERYKLGGISTQKLATEIGISQSQVHNIVSGKQWVLSA